MLAGWDGHARVLISVGDTIKESSKAAIASLRALGITPYLVTGDSEATALAVAREVGIDADHVVAEVLPAEKVEVVRRLRDDNRAARLRGHTHVVAMVGDGVNDAAALAEADLGLSMGTGTDVAIEASDLTLVRGDLAAAPDAIRLARRDPVDDPRQPVLGLRLQRRRDPARRARPAQPHDRRRGDGLFQRLRRVQQPAAAALQAEPGLTGRSSSGRYPAVTNGPAGPCPRGHSLAYAGA